MLHSQLFQLVTLSLFLVFTVTAAPLDQDEETDNEIDEFADTELSYDTYRRYKRQEETWPTEKMRDIERLSCQDGEGYLCEPCAIGYYKPIGTKKKRCARCGSDYSTPQEGAKWCTRKCKPGFRLEVDAPGIKRTCVKCDIGFYQPEETVDYNCIACPNNMTTTRVGRKSIDDCVYLCRPGQKLLEDRNCTKCEIGFYQPNANNDYSCTPCPPGKITQREGRVDISDCILTCPPGSQRNSDDTECDLCPEGTYKPAEGPEPCKICNMNKTTVVDGAVMANECKVPCDPGREYDPAIGRCSIRCESGTYKPELSSRAKCRPCPENFTPNLDRAATDCVLNCEPGYEINSRQDNCTACELGFYKNGTGNTQCHACPGDQLTFSKGAGSREDCQEFNACAKPLVENLELLFGELDGFMKTSESFIDLMVNTCSLGRSDMLVQLLEEVVASLQTCGVVGQLSLRDVDVGGETYRKEYYLEIFQKAYYNGGMCDFVLCLPDTVPEIQMSQTWIRNDTCPPTESECFCTETYRALATSFHTNLMNCPALEFHSEFLAVNMGGPEMVESLLNSANISDFCALPNGCAEVNCGQGRCISLSTGGYRCRCWPGYIGDACEIALTPTQETEPDMSWMKTTIVTSHPSSCECSTQTIPTPEPCPSCPTCECPECPPPMECPLCASCPDATCPPAAPCETPTPADLPTCPPCPTTAAPTEPPACPTCATCPNTTVPTCPPCATCPTTPPPTDPPTCPPCPTTAAPTQPPACPTCATCPNTTVPTCPPCATCPTTPPPTDPPTCPPCPTTTEPTPCPTCPTTPVPTEPPTCPPCATCPTTPPPTPCNCPVQTEPPTCPPCLTCPTTPPPTPCNCPVQTEPPTCPPCATCQTSQTPCNCSTPEPSTCAPCAAYPTPSPTTSQQPVTCNCSTETETLRCENCESHMLDEYFASGKTICGPGFANKLQCFIENGCSEQFMAEKYSLYSMIVPQSPLPWSTFTEMATSQIVYCSSHTSTPVPSPSSSTPKPSSTAYPSETQRCENCESHMLNEYFISGNTICGSGFVDKIHCFIDNECSEQFFGEKYPLYSMIVPQNPLPWSTFTDMATSQIVYCSSLSSTTSPTPSSPAFNPSSTTYTTGTASSPSPPPSLLPTTPTTAGTAEACDIRQSTCNYSMSCVYDETTGKSSCRCAQHGLDSTGLCRVSGALLEESCDPESMYPCWDTYGMECNKTTAPSGPVCKCKEGFTNSSNQYCSQGPANGAQLNEECDPTIKNHCKDYYTMECKPSNGTYRCTCMEEFIPNYEYLYCQRKPGYIYADCEENNTCHNGLNCSTWNTCECPQNYTSFDERTCVPANGTRLDGHCHLWSYCYVNNSHCLSYNNGQYSPKCQCLAGYMNDGNNRCIRIPGTKEECQMDGRNCLATDNKECIWAYSNLNGRIEHLNWCECITGFTRQADDTCQPAGTATSSNVSSTESTPPQSTANYHGVACPETIPNGYVLQTCSRDYNSLCYTNEYECYTGYVKSPAGSVTCNLSGQWEWNNIAGKPCALEEELCPLQISNGELVWHCHRQTGALCNYHCNTGCTEHPSISWLYCESNGQWNHNTDDLCNCTALFQSQPPSELPPTSTTAGVACPETIPNGYVLQTCSRDLNSHCYTNEYECYTGYVKSPAGSVTCNSSGQWEWNNIAGKPCALEEELCPLQISNGELVWHCHRQTGALCNYHCNTGCTEHPSISWLYCESNGQWNHNTDNLCNCTALFQSQPPSELPPTSTTAGVACPETIPNGYVLQTCSRDLNSHCYTNEYECYTGYVKSPAGSVTCNSSGQWEWNNIAGKPCALEEELCPLQISNGELVWHCHRQTGVLCNYHCNTGCTEHPSISWLYCESNGQWNHNTDNLCNCTALFQSQPPSELPPTSTTAGVACPETIPNGYVLQTCSRDLNSHCYTNEYECYTGYVKSPAGSVTCNSSGQWEWNNIAGKPCALEEELCPLQISNGELVWHCHRQTGALCNYHCNTGCTEHPSISWLYCESNGQWNHNTDNLCNCTALFQSQPPSELPPTSTTAGVACPETIPNGYVLQTCSRDLNSHCYTNEYECYTGYVKSPAGSVTCNSSGQWEWNNIAGKPCALEEELCPLQISNGELVWHCHRQTGALCNYHCNTGCTEHPSISWLYCESNGQWNHNTDNLCNCTALFQSQPPSELPPTSTTAGVACPETIPNGYVLPTCSRDLNSHCYTNEYECYTGYVKSPAGSVTCNSSGQWEWNNIAGKPCALEEELCPLQISNGELVWHCHRQTGALCNYHCNTGCTEHPSISWLYCESNGQWNHNTDNLCNCTALFQSQPPSELPPTSTTAGTASTKSPWPSQLPTTSTTAGTAEACDIRQSTCNYSMSCVYDETTGKSSCRCAQHGLDSTGSCRVSGALLEESCDPESMYPCWDIYGMQCNKTTAPGGPVCKCKEGFSNSSNQYCSQGPANRSQLNEECDPTIKNHCVDYYSMECKPVNGTNRCTCMDEFMPNNEYLYCQKKPGYIYAECEENMLCYNDLNCSLWNTCECPQNYTSFDERNCVPANGTRLDGHCHLWTYCYVNNSKCYSNEQNSPTCQCLAGYMNDGNNRCIRIPDTKEECQSDSKNCLATNNKECIWAYGNHNNRIEYLKWCECTEGYTRQADDTCQPEGTAPYYPSLKPSTQSYYVTPCSDPNGCICSPGFFMFNGTCTICPVGMECIDGMDPMLCPVGYYSTLGSSTCLLCPFGTYSAIEGSESCSPCPEGTYSPEGALVCIMCPAGFECSSGSQPSECPAGTFSHEGSDFCTDCPENYFCSAPGTAEPLPCPTGYVSPVGSSSCNWPNQDDAVDECDIRQMSCNASMQCMYDVEKNKASCYCTSHGLDPTTGQCRAVGALLEESCDLASEYPCWESYAMECNKTTAPEGPVCKCKQGYIRQDEYYCHYESTSGILPGLNEECNATMQNPCMDHYSMECRPVNGTDRCTCREDFRQNDFMYCEKRPGYMWADCETGEVKCYNGLNCSIWNTCECPTNFTTYDSKTCVPANGTLLGGHCHMWSYCYVNNSKCDTSTGQPTCQCLAGYKNDENNKCIRIAGTKQECLWDGSNCLASDNTECFWAYSKYNGRVENKYFCECIQGYIRGADDKCVQDVTSCAFCQQKFEKALYLSSMQHGCSKNMSAAVDCFTNNCNDDEFQLYREDFNSNLFMYTVIVSTVHELPQIYGDYCAGYILGKECAANACYVAESVCVNGTCSCSPSFVMVDDSCRSTVLGDYWCMDDYMCTHLNALCMGETCACPEGYAFDVQTDRCGSTNMLHEECNAHLSQPCKAQYGWPMCEYDFKLGRATCECGRMGYNATSQTCADHEARDGERCNENTEQPCEIGAECDMTSNTCRCKPDHVVNEYGYCYIPSDTPGILDHGCVDTLDASLSCKGENVVCNGGICDCRTDENYYRNYYSYTCYKSSMEDGSLGSPCQHTYICNDPNAICDYLGNTVPQCLCQYGFINESGLCIKDPEIPDDCQTYSCEDKNAVCKGQEITFDNRYTYKQFCMCKNGYSRDEITGKCQPANCDGCLEEFFKLDLHPLCQTGGYSVIKCAEEKMCTDASNFGKIVSSVKLMEYDTQINLQNISTVRDSYKFLCDGQVAGGHCDKNHSCNADLGLTCVQDGSYSYCECIHGSADMYGLCFETPSNGYCPTATAITDSTCMWHCQSSSECQAGQICCVSPWCTEMQCTDPVTDPAEDICSNSMCYEGSTCFPDAMFVDGYRCDCPSGRSGMYCEMPIDAVEDICTNNMCYEGSTCFPDATFAVGYRCDCPSGRSGMFCEMSIDVAVEDICTNNMCYEGSSCFPDAMFAVGYRCDCPSGRSGVYCEMSIDEDAVDECDIRQMSCNASMQCMYDVETNKASCYCTSHGLDSTTGQCRAVGSLLEESCDPASEYPCWESYAMECNKTTAPEGPVCKCKQGYIRQDEYSCHYESTSGILPGLNEECNATMQNPCMDHYTMECTPVNGTNRCTCREEFRQNDFMYCEKRPGYMWADCETGEVKCYNGLHCSMWNTCECPTNYTTFDSRTCVPANGTVLGGHCHLSSYCYVNNSKCDSLTGQPTCQCLAGYKNDGNNKCIRIAGTKRECQWDFSNCLASDYTECFWAYSKNNGRLENRPFCECIQGYIRGADDKCVQDVTSCAFCQQKFEKALYLSSVQHGCSKNMSNAVDCFTNNCNDDEFQLYREDFNSRLFMHTVIVSTVHNLPQIYGDYCAGFILGKECAANACHVAESVCVNGTCSCSPSFVMVDDSCRSTVLGDYWCMDDNMCTHLNALCMGETCACPEGYAFDVQTDRCRSTNMLHEECNAHLSQPCKAQYGWPVCEYDFKSGRATCECGRMGYNATSQTCADHEARDGERCNENTEQPCEIGAECDMTSNTCRCKPDHVVNEYGYCYIPSDTPGILDHGCVDTLDASLSCKGENVVCNGGICDCRTDENYYRNYYSFTCYKSSMEDGSLGSPCQYTYSCNDPNAICDYLGNTVPQCLCQYGFINESGLCIKDPEIPDDCQTYSCEDENAVCKGQEITFDNRYTYKQFCMCKNGYSRDETTGKCQPANCDGCLEEFLKLDLHPLCQTGGYSVIKCAEEKMCTDASNFGKIVSSVKLMEYDAEINLQNISTVRDSYTFLCDGQVAGGHCDKNHSCNGDLGLTCVSDGSYSYCECIHGSVDIYGQCFETPSTGYCPTATAIMDPTCMMHCQSSSECPAGQICCVNPWCTEMQCSDPVTEPAEDICSNNMCYEGSTCFPDAMFADGYRCDCPSGRSGIYCDMPIDAVEDICTNNMCYEGSTCFPDASFAVGYRCDCPSGRSGMYCEMPIDGVEDICTNNMCYEGSSCFPDAAFAVGYRCDCPSGRSGVYCEMSINGDAAVECDIRQVTCNSSKDCLYDEDTFETSCYCAQHGFDSMTGQCRVFWPQLEESCEPESMYPCSDSYGMECNKTTDSSGPVCKCKEGFTNLDNHNCYEGGNLPQLNEQCDPTLPKPCMDSYSMECKHVNGSNHCTCKEGYQIYSASMYCEKMPGYLYATCQSGAVKCYNGLNCSSWNTCECPTNYTSFDEMTCVPANGTLLGGYCHQWFNCYVNNSKCDYSTDRPTCQCLTGYRNDGNNKCTRIPGAKEECRSDTTNCLSVDNKSCIWAYSRSNGRFHYKQWCECNIGYIRNTDDKCVEDVKSCAHCQQKFEKFLYLSSMKQGCSRNMSDVVDCFGRNCIDEEFELYREDLNNRLFMYMYQVTTLADLPLKYAEYCAGYILEKECLSNACFVPESICEAGVCVCDPSFTMVDDSCRSSVLEDVWCMAGDDYMCSYLNALCMDEKCACPQGYDYDVRTGRCGSTRFLHEECNIHLSQPCAGNGWSFCKYNYESRRTTCECGQLGYNTTSQTCADHEARNGEKCNENTNQPCISGAECDLTSKTCRCKTDYSSDQFGYCYIASGTFGILDYSCIEGVNSQTCKGENVVCNGGVCDCRTDDNYYKNHYNHTCYRSSIEDGKLGSPCEYSGYCENPNAKCEYVANNLRLCLCDYGFINQNGQCVKDEDIPDDCPTSSCEDENAVCKGQEITFDNRYTHKQLCMCKSGYRRDETTGKCQPENCDGCLEEFLKLDLYPLCQTGGYSVIKCAEEKMCTDASNFGKIVSSAKLMVYDTQINLTNISTVKDSYKSICDGQVAGGHCDETYSCNSDLGLTCVLDDDTDMNWMNSHCACTYGSADPFGRCLESSSTSFCPTDKLNMDSACAWPCQSDTSCPSGQICCVNHWCSDMQCMDPVTYSGSTVNDTSQGQEISGIFCLDDFDCIEYNALCIKYDTTYGSCRCSPRQMLDGTHCVDGYCPSSSATSTDSPVSCGSLCYSNDQCGVDKICCPDSACMEHCVLPMFYLESCQSCLDNFFYPLDLQTSLCQTGGYTANDCFRKAGCSNQTNIHEILFDGRLRMYEGILNFDSLDTLWTSYRAFCDGQVSGSYCTANGTCNAENLLECYHPDGYLTENSKCQCQAGYQEDQFGRCITPSEDPCQTCLDMFNALDLTVELCQPGGYEVRDCAGACPDQSRLQEMVTSYKFDQWSHLLNRTDLDSLGSSYEGVCNGKVAGGDCNVFEKCDTSLGLECMLDTHRCMCAADGQDNLGHCLIQNQIIDVIPCATHVDCMFMNGYCDGVCRCPSNQGADKSTGMCNTEISSFSNCYQYTSDEEILIGTNALTERDVCEMRKGRVFTAMYNKELYPNCPCNCCMLDYDQMPVEEPGSTEIFCFYDTDCTAYNAKCIKNDTNAYGSCRCSLRQMLDGTHCVDGYCPSYTARSTDSPAPCGTSCYTNDECEDDKICCPDSACMEHCVLPTFYLESCQSCLDNYFYPFDLQTSLCQTGGYTVNDCFSKAGCNDQTNIYQIMYDDRLRMYEGILNFDSLDDLWNSYRAYCDGQVSGSYCTANGTCNAENLLECYYPDGYLTENSRCQCQAGYQEDQFGRCIPPSEDPCQTCLDMFNALDLTEELCIPGGYEIRDCAGACPDQSRLQEMVTSYKFDQWSHLLNRTDLDSLGSSYEGVCNGKVAGGDCNLFETCDESLGLECMLDNHRCKCAVDGQDDLGHCLIQNQIIDVIPCATNMDCSFMNGYCDGVCRCPSNQGADKTTGMCNTAVSNSYICYQYTLDEEILIGTNGLSERDMCEMKKGRVFTAMYNTELYPNCSCNCCMLDYGLMPVEEPGTDNCNCDLYATCVYEPGVTPYCECVPGFVGDGHTCYDEALYKRTVIMMQYNTSSTNDQFFLRGGYDGCGAVSNDCGIPIVHKRNGTSNSYAMFNAWKQDDQFLDWNGAEIGQGYYIGMPPHGTPMVSTSSNAASENYSNLNRFGENYWMIDFYMMCDAIGWFEVKGYPVINGVGYWENSANVMFFNPCYDINPAAQSINHKAKCGMLNVLKYEDYSSCIVEPIP